MSDLTSRLQSALGDRYRIERLLGEGGTAVVYLAEDLRHHRKVALKVLKPDLAAAVGATRFLTEIRTTASLQHPHILPLHDSGDVDGLLFYVMPFVEGESLRGRLDRERQLPVDEAVRIATGVAEALDYAHRQGVVHRDIKPANILLLDGKAVVADFGIALALRTAREGRRLTETGLAIGTPYYMSPEQATGDPATGPPTDIYSLGCVLYEALIGEPPFVGATPPAVLAKIATADAPSAAAERPSVPTNVDSAIRTALEKLPADRFRTATGFVEALGNEAYRNRASSAQRHESRNVRGWQIAALLSTAALVFTLVTRSGEVPPIPAPVRYSIPLPGSLESGAEFFHHGISPDGRYVATSGRAGEEDGIFVRRLTESEWRLLPGTERSGEFMWSPDGRSLAFFAAQSLMRVGVDGGEAVEIAPLAPGNHFASTGAWGSAGTILLTQPSRRGLWVVPASGGEPQPLDPQGAPGDARYPTFLPDGKRFLFSRYQGPEPGIYLASLDDPVGRRLLPDRSGAVFAPPSGDQRVGHLVFVRDGRLVARPVRPGDLAFMGEAFPVNERALTHDNFRPAVYVAEGGVLAFLAGTARDFDSEMMWVDRTGEILAVEGPPGIPTPVSLAPGGDIAGVVRGSGSGDVWLRDLDRGIENPFTFQAALSPWSNVVWGPGGARIAFATARLGADNTARYAVHVGIAAQPRSTQEVMAGGRRQLPTDWTVDGKLILTEHDPETGADLSYVQVGPDGTAGDPVAIRRDEFDTSGGRVSPDGRWLAYVSNETDRFEVWVEEFLGGGARWRISNGPTESVQPSWSADGAELYYVTGNGRRLMVASVGSPTVPGGSPVGESRLLLDTWISRNDPIFASLFYASAEDGERFLISGLRNATEPAFEVLSRWEEVLDVAGDGSR